MNRTETGVRGFHAFHSPGTIIPGRGGVIDWSRVTDEFFIGAKFTVKLNGAVAVGADSLTVDALTKPLKKGAIIRGADVDTVVVTVDTGGALANATSVPVTALSGPIPNGTTLRFGTKKFVALTAAAAAGATSLTVEAIPTALAGAETATYQGGENNIEVLADAAEGATSVSVGNILFPMADDTELEATSATSRDYLFIPQCTVMAKAQTSGLLIPRRVGVVANGETAIGFLISDASNKSRFDAKSGYGIAIGGTAIWENLLPDSVSGDLSGTYKTELVANGAIFQFMDWVDSRVS